MIRAGAPLPPALRLRMQADAAAEGIARNIRTVRRRFVSVARNQDSVAGNAPGVDLRHPETIGVAAFEAMRIMLDFVSRYDDLIDLLCWTAKEGVNNTRRSRYVDLRAWFLEHYELVRPSLTRHLEAHPEDREPVVAGTPAPRDAFESLFLPAQIDVLINSESVIHRIMRTRRAVEACRDELGRACVYAG